MTVDYLRSLIERCRSSLAMLLPVVACLALLASPTDGQVAVPTPDGAELFRIVVGNAGRCASGKRKVEEVLKCFLDASPKGCASQVRDQFAGREGAPRAWFFCVAECASAGFFSRTLGNCSRNID